MNSLARVIEIVKEREGDFPTFAHDALKIRMKSGETKAFELNAAQKYLHDRIEKQLKDTGKVRALVLKGRQQGVSTYIEGRFMWKAVFSYGLRAFILTHEDKATENLFEMAQRYYDNLPEPKPLTSAENAKELHFKELDSGYAVGTARTKAVGRSSTIQLFHGSEVAFWPNADTHMAGILQAVPDAPGTEVFLESTANGMGNVFHTKWKMAEKGQGEYIAVFIPWFITPEYRKEPTKGFSLTQLEREYQRVHKLDVKQMAFRRAKIEELGSEWLFKQEYPASAQEAFQTSTTDPYITTESVMAARKRFVETDAGLIMGVDPARGGGCKSAIAYRYGRHLQRIDTYDFKDTTQLVGVLAASIKKHKPRAVFIDDVGLGGPITDRLRELGFDVIGVNSGEACDAPEDDKFHNLRAKIWYELKHWLREAQIPDDDDLHAEICCLQKKLDSSGRLLMEKKEDLIKRGESSPDMADALALTFSRTVAVFDPPTILNEEQNQDGGQDGFAW